MVGANPTNQKIYFGAHDGSPLEFWIAGRETAANEGEISANGDIMTLYQAKSVEQKQFNASASGYKENPTVALQDEQFTTYTGSPAVYSGTVTYQNVAGTTLNLPENNPTYQYSTDGGSTWTDGMPTNAGTYKIRAKVVPNGDYESATSAPVTFIIDKKSITPQITAENKDYDGTTEAHVSVTFDGLIDGETLDKDVDYTIDSATFDNANAENGKTVTATISLTESDTAKNYQLSSTQATTTADINKKSITPRITAYSKDYDGTKNATISVTFDDLVAGETLTLDEDYTIDSATFENANAGENKTVTVTFTSLNNTTKAKNYQLSSTQATTANINKKSITPKVTVNSKEYDGTTDAEVVSVEFEGLVAGENLTLDDDYTIDSATFENVNAGDGKTVTATIKLNGTTKANNYTLRTNSATATADINKKSITPQITAENKDYDGNSEATVSVSFGGLQNNEELTEGTDYNVSAKFADANEGKNKAVTATIYLTESDKAKNYQLSSNQATMTADINKKSITPQITAENKDYDGNNEATISVKFDGLVAGETLKKDVDYTIDSAIFDNANAENGKTVTATISLTESDTAKNYQLSSTQATTTADINKKSITPRITAYSKDYDGTKNATISVTFDDLVAGETLTLDEDYTIDSATFENANAGENKTVTVTFTSLNNTTKAKNYQLSSTQATTANINKKSITPKVTVNSKEYDGTTDAEVVSVEFEGLVAGENLTLDDDYTIDSATFDNVNAGENKTVTVTFTSLNNTAKANNYTLSSAQATTAANIDKKSITPQITAENKDYDGTTDATVSVKFDGLVDGETLKKDVDYTIDSAIFEDKEVGTEKTVTATVSLKNNNYTFIDGDGNPTTEAEISGVTASITPKSITVTADNQTKIEGEADPELTYTVEGLVGEDSLIGSLERGPGDDVGTYEITQGTLTNVNNPNYNIEFTPGTFTIKVDKSGWGTPEEHGEIIHYVDAEGMTSVEISSENTDANGIVWLREESYDSNLGRNTATWYGLDNSSGIFQESSRFYVQWLNEQEHPEAFENIDEETRAEIENNNGWLFEVGVIAPDGVPYKQLEETIDFYVQIGDDWDESDLEGFYITLENDESVPVRYGTTAYPEGTDDFGIMSLSHFSPYFIYDKLSDEEKAQLDAAAIEFAAQQEEKAIEANEVSIDESTQTSDEITYFTISGLGLIMTLALGLMINSKINKKKFD